MILDSFRTWNRRRIQRHRLAKPVQNTPHGFKFIGLPKMMSGDYEEAELKAFRQLLPEVDLVIDAGAHYGFYVCVAQSAGVPVIAFEPDRTNVGMIAKNLQANGWGKDVIVLPVAVGFERGMFEMRGGGSGGTLADGFSKAPKSQVQTVPVVRIDDVVELADRKALIIIDVEGFELNALRGAEKLLSCGNKPVLVVEIFPNEIGADKIVFREDYLQIFELMTDAGYKTYFFGNQSLEAFELAKLQSLFARKDPETPSGNFLFVAPENENLLPGREMSRTKLKEILDVVRVRGETGSHRDPIWSSGIDTLGEALDNAVADTIGDRSLSDLLDEQENSE